MLSRLVMVTLGLLSLVSLSAIKPLEQADALVASNSMKRSEGIISSVAYSADELAKARLSGPVFVNFTARLVHHLQSQRSSGYCHAKYARFV